MKNASTIWRTTIDKRTVPRNTARLMRVRGSTSLSQMAPPKRFSNSWSTNRSKCSEVGLTRQVTVANNSKSSKKKNDTWKIVLKWAISRQMGLGQLFSSALGKKNGFDVNASPVGDLVNQEAEGGPLRKVYR